MYEQKIVPVVKKTVYAFYVFSFCKIVDIWNIFCIFAKQLVSYS